MIIICLELLPVCTLAHIYLNYQTLLILLEHKTFFFDLRAQFSRIRSRFPIHASRLFVLAMNINFDERARGKEATKIVGELASPKNVVLENVQH